MRRRALLTAFAGAALGAPGARGQAPGRLRRVGVLTPSRAQFLDIPFLDELRASGHEIGRTLTVELASAEGALPKLGELAAALRRGGAEVIVAVSTPGVRAAIDSGFAGPIVATIVGDPLALGFVRDLARPEGNVTGISNQSVELTGKRLGLLREVVPDLNRLAAFLHPDDPIAPPQLRELSALAQGLGIAVRPFPMRDADDLARAVDEAVAWRAQAISRLVGQALTIGPATGRLALERGLPAMVLDRPSVEAGGLLAFFANYDDLWRRTASHVDRLLRGALPADLPFEQPTRFDLILDAGAARRLGLTLPPTLLASADEVIE